MFWTLYYDTMEGKNYDSHKKGFWTEKGCRKFYEKVEEKEYVVQAWAEGPRKQRVTYEEFPTDIYSVNAALTGYN